MYRSWVALGLCVEELLLCCCAGLVFIIMVRIVIWISVCVRRLSVNIDSDGTISTGDQSVEKGDLIVTFNFDGERDVGVN